MRKTAIKAASLILAVGTVLSCTACSLTKTSVTSEIETTTSYVSGSGTTSEQGGETVSNSEINSTGGAIGNTTGGNTAQNAGNVDNSKEKKLKGTLELQIFVGGYGSELWEYAISEFQKVQPNLEINAHMDTNVNAQMKTRWAKDNPPDFVLIDGTNIPKSTWLKEGKFRDLTNLYKNGYVYGTNKKISEQIKNGLVTTYANTGKVYDMPVLLATYGMWYNETLFKSKGLSVPKNFTELQSFCKSAKTAGINPIIYPGTYSGYLVWGLLMPAVASEAVASNDLNYLYDVMNATNEKVFADNRFKNAVKKIETLAKAGYFDPSGLSMNHITSQANWLKNSDALIPNGLWLENEMKDSIPADFKMRYYPSMLQDAGKPTCIIASSTTVGIAAKAKNPEAAEAFLRFLYTDSVAMKFAELGGVPSAAKTDVSSAKLTESAKQVNAMINSSSVTLISKGSTTWGSVDATMNESINSLVSGKITADEMISELQKATKKKQ